MNFFFLCLKVSGDSYIQGCTFHDGFSPSIGVFGTEGLNIDDNIIHHTVGEGKHCAVHYCYFRESRVYSSLYSKNNL